MTDLRKGAAIHYGSEISLSQLRDFCARTADAIGELPDANPERLKRARSIPFAVAAFYQSLVQNKLPLAPVIGAHAYWMRILVLRLGFSSKDFGPLAYSPAHVPAKDELEVRRIWKEITSANGVSRVPAPVEEQRVRSLTGSFGVSVTDHLEVLTKEWAEVATE